MDISAIGTEARTDPKQSISGEFDQFLLLLTTQLRNQDPTDPLDANEFTQQMVDFAGVEQAIQTNTNLEEIISLTQLAQVNTAVGYLGNRVEAAGNKIELSKGSSEFSYDISAEAEKAFITIIDEGGNLVFSSEAASETGKNEYTWDGKDNQGNSLPDGIYNLTVTAVDEEGGQVEVTTAVSGEVTGVAIDGSDVILSIGDTDVLLDDVISIRSPLKTSSEEGSES